MYIDVVDIIYQRISFVGTRAKLELGIAVPPELGIAELRMVGVCKARDLATEMKWVLPKATGVRPHKASINRL